jgi:hypothetical protein
MAKQYANIQPGFDTFAAWVTKTNNLLDDMSTVVITTAANTIGGYTSGNAYVNGFFSANTIAITQTLRGGTIATAAPLAIGSNVAISNGYSLYIGNSTVNVSINATSFSGIANTALALNTARTISANTDVTGSVSFDGSANVTIALTLSNTAVVAATYGNTTSVPIITVDSKGRITGVSNAAISIPAGGVTTFNGRSGAVVISSADITGNTTSGLGYTPVTANGNANIAGNLTLIGNTDFSARDGLFSRELRVGNSTVNSVVNSSIISIGNVSATATGLSVGNSTVNSVVNSSIISIGNVSATATGLLVGNSTVNSVVNSSIISIGNVSATATRLSVGNSTVNTAVNSTAISVIGIYSNGSLGANGSTLYSNGTGTYWAVDPVLVNNNTFSGNNIFSGANTTFTGAINTVRAIVASAATTSAIWAASGNEIDFTGTATITNFPAAPQAGSTRVLHIASTPVFTHNATIFVPGSATYTAAAGDVITIHAITTTTFRLEITKVDGTSVVAAASASGGTQFVASGTIANGAVIALNANGTVSQIGLETNITGLNTFTIVSANSTTAPNYVSWSPMGNTGIIVTYVSNATSANAWCVIGTFTGNNNITFSTPTTYAINPQFGATYGRCWEQTSVAFNSSANQALFCSRAYGQYDDGYGGYTTTYIQMIRSANVSGNTLTFGTQSNTEVVSSAFPHRPYYSEGHNRFITLGSNTNANTDVNLVNIAANGAVSFTSVVANAGMYNTYYLVDGVYDKLSNTFIFCDAGVYGGLNGATYQIAKLNPFSISGNTITRLANVHINDSNTYMASVPRLTYNSAIKRYTITSLPANPGQIAGNTDVSQIRVMVLPRLNFNSVQQTYITPELVRSFGNTVGISNNHVPLNLQTVYDARRNRQVIYYTQSNSPYYTKTIPIYIDLASKTITSDNVATLISTANVSVISAKYIPGIANTLYVTASTQNNQVYMHAVDYSNTIPTALSSLGIVQTGAANGSNVTISTPGSTITGLSGLESNTVYYVSLTGISQIPSDFGKIGIATSNTTLLVTGLPAYDRP